MSSNTVALCPPPRRSQGVRIQVADHVGEVSSPVVETRVVDFAAAFAAVRSPEVGQHIRGCVHREEQRRDVAKQKGLEALRRLAALD